MAAKEAKETAAEGKLKVLKVEPQMLIAKLAEELKKLSEIKPPKWAAFVKTGAHKERPPAQKEWWYVRAAAVLRAVSKLGPVGTQKLRTKYGGKQSRGYASERFRKGSGSIIRQVLQQLEKAGLVRQIAKGVHKGRVITAKAASLINKVAKQHSTGNAGKHEAKAANESQ